MPNVNYHIISSLLDEFLRSREVTVLLSMFRSFNDDNLKDLERELSTNGQKKTIQMVKESLKDIGYQMLAEDLKTKMQKSKLKLMIVCVVQQIIIEILQRL